MNCAKCENEMIAGNLLGDRYALKWMPGNEKLTLGVLAKNAITFKSSGMFGRPKVEAFVCHDCQTMVIDMNGKTK
ncbi:PF20097 family protein [Enterococcus sp.]|uniref:PF20097 family protein n=1 Tax=Enterococcus sp. TaxID=35783 RepID=UPI002FCAD9A7